MQAATLSPWHTSAVRGAEAQERRSVMNDHQPLSGKVAVVAGATRGAGRAFAVEFAAAGAIVYATGRSSRGRRSEMDRPETIEDTAARAAEAGGEAVPVVCDHLEPIAGTRAGGADRVASAGASTSSSTTSGAATTSPDGTPSCGSTISTPAFASCGWPSTPTSSPATPRFRC